MAELETLAVFRDIVWAAELTDNASGVTVYTDSLEPLKALYREPKEATAFYDVQMLSKKLKGTKDIKTQVLRVSGHSSNEGNKAAHALATEFVSNRLQGQ